MTKWRLALVCTALLSAACGARLDDDVLAANQAGADRGGNGGGVAQAAATTTTAPVGGQVAASGGAAAVAGTGGTEASGATGGAADPNAAAAGGGTCVPSGASDVGVTESSITLGEVSTLTGPIPGIGQSIVNGVKAYLAYLNSTAGGVCGRTVELQIADDRLDTGVHRSETARLSSQVFGLVGGWAVTDDGGASVLQGTNIPDVTLGISEARSTLPNNFSPNPIAPGTSGNRAVLSYMVSHYGVQTAAVVWGAQVTARNSALRFVAELESLGVDVSIQQEVAITETNYVPVAQAIENAGSDLLITALEITGISRLAQAFEQVEFLPTVPYYGAQTYGNRFIELAGSAAEGATIAITHPIVEEAGSNPAVALFQEWYQRVNPGAELDFFAFEGWVAAAMFTDAILAAGPSPTRDSVLEVLRTYTAYDAHGLVAPINPAEKQGASCFMVVTVRDGAWQRVYPEGSGFGCP
jgi:ABC-type branched-subunit amino acid transport system substrate-binding protein